MRPWSRTPNASYRSGMILTAITREVSATINECELSFHGRQRIDVVKAIAQPTTAGSSDANMKC